METASTKISTVSATNLARKSLRSCLVLPWNDNIDRHKDSLEGYLPQAALFSWAPKALTATITARVVSCGDAFVG
jgi:hypothetical protein